MPGGERVGSTGYEADLCDPSAAWLRLFYSVTPARGGRQVQRDYRVTLDTTRPPFGGVRWWFICPSTGQRVAKLYLPNGGTIFAGRCAYRLAYQSQRSTRVDRSHARQRRIFAKLGEEYHRFEQLPPCKPKWMRWRTYAQLRAELEAAEAAHEGVFMVDATRFLARLKAHTPRRRKG